MAGGYFSKSDAQSILDEHKGRQTGRRGFKRVPHQIDGMPHIFVELPENGWGAASDDGATPTVEDCVVYQPKGDGTGELEQVLDDNNQPLTVEVFHYGGAIQSRANHTYKYGLAAWTPVGWLISVEYCS